MILTKIIYILFFIKIIDSQELIGSKKITCNDNGCQSYCAKNNANKGICNKYNFCVCDNLNENADFNLFSIISYYDGYSFNCDTFIGFCENVNDGKIDLKVKDTEPNFDCTSNNKRTYVKDYEWKGGWKEKDDKIGKLLICKEKSNINKDNIKDQCEKVYGGIYIPIPYDTYYNTSVCNKGNTKGYSLTKMN